MTPTGSTTEEIFFVPPSVVTKGLPSTISERAASSRFSGSASDNFWHRLPIPDEPTGKILRKDGFLPGRAEGLELDVDQMWSDCATRWVHGLVKPLGRAELRKRLGIHTDEEVGFLLDCLGVPSHIVWTKFMALHRDNPQEIVALCEPTKTEKKKTVVPTIPIEEPLPESGAVEHADAPDPEVGATADSTRRLHDNRGARRRGRGGKGDSTDATTEAVATEIPTENTQRSGEPKPDSVPETEESISAAPLSEDTAAISDTQKDAPRTEAPKSPVVTPTREVLPPAHPSFRSGNAEPLFPNRSAMAWIIMENRKILQDVQIVPLFLPKNDSDREEALWIIATQLAYPHQPFMLQRDYNQRFCPENSYGLKSIKIAERAFELNVGGVFLWIFDHRAPAHLRQAVITLNYDLNGQPTKWPLQKVADAWTNGDVQRLMELVTICKLRRTVSEFRIPPPAASLGRLQKQEARLLMRLLYHHRDDLRDIDEGLGIHNIEHTRLVLHRLHVVELSCWTKQLEIWENQGVKLTNHELSQALDLLFAATSSGWTKQEAIVKLRYVDPQEFDRKCAAWLIRQPDSWAMKIPELERQVATPSPEPTETLEPPPAPTDGTAPAAPEGNGSDDATPVEVHDMPGFDVVDEGPVMEPTGLPESDDPASPDIPTAVEVVAETAVPRSVSDFELAPVSTGPESTVVLQPAEGVDGVPEPT